MLKEYIVTIVLVILLIIIIYASNYNATAIEQDKARIKELEEENNKYLQKLVYALSPTTHVLGDNYNDAFKKIIAENIDLETCKIRQKLKECWGIDKKY